MSDTRGVGLAGVGAVALLSVACGGPRIERRVVAAGPPWELVELSNGSEATAWLALEVSTKSVFPVADLISGFEPGMSVSEARQKFGTPNAEKSDGEGAVHTYRGRRGDISVIEVAEYPSGGGPRRMHAFVRASLTAADVPPAVANLLREILKEEPGTMEVHLVSGIPDERVLTVRLKDGLPVAVDVEKE
jgi:hypothetical protein